MIPLRVLVVGLLCLVALAGEAIAQPTGEADGAPLPGTERLTATDDLASRMVDGIDRFLLREIDASRAIAADEVRRAHAAGAERPAKIAALRRRLSNVLGLRDARPAFAGFERVDTLEHAGPIAKAATYEAIAVRWRAFGDVFASGLVLRPTRGRPKAFVVAAPDADVSPEQIAGLAAGVPRESQFARRLAEAGCFVVVPTLIDREAKERRSPGGDRKVTLTTREFLYRPAFVLGRHPLGYELQMTLAAVDGCEAEAKRLAAEMPDAKPPIGVFGHGEGGLLALYAAALDERIAAAVVSGAFDDRREMWKHPLDRNLFGLLTRFGDAEVASLIAPRGLVIEAAVGPRVVVAPGGAGGPGTLDTPAIDRVRAEVARLGNLVSTDDLAAPAGRVPNAWLVERGAGDGAYGSRTAIDKFCALLGLEPPAASDGEPAERLRDDFDVEERRENLTREIVRHHEAQLRESPRVRGEFMRRLDFSSVEAYRASVERYREHFAEEVIGRFDRPLAAANPRTRRVYDREKGTGYEVALDVFDDVFAYGILLVPKDVRDGERRPVVVCQHGLEGRPTDVVVGDHPAYHDFAAKLAERGFVVFAPQNPYLFRDRFRALQRKANPLQKTLFSVIVPQHQRIVDWLQTLPFVDPERIGFYGLSYGGKTAMRVPALVTDYALSICSADFNDWVEKTASATIPESYVWTGEYEIFEFGLAETFNYAEMAALIAPRPFMVERGHFDGVASDDMVGREFARVLNLYQARLKLNDACRVEWFDGPHTINGRGTFDFLHAKLAWPVRESR